MAEGSTRTMRHFSVEPELDAQPSKPQLGTSWLYGSLSSTASPQSACNGDDETRSTDSGSEAHVGSHIRNSAIRPHKRDLIRMLAVVAAFAVGLQGILAGLDHARRLARRSRSERTDVVEEFALPDLSKHASHLKEHLPHVNLTDKLKFTSSRLQHLKDHLPHVNLTNKINFTLPQLQNPKDMMLLPSFIDVQHEYYDSGKVIMGSWHWLSCNKKHLKKCKMMAVHGCCCEPGFAYVAANAGGPVVKGAAAGAAGGAIITGALLGSDVGASTATGAATGAVGGVVHYLLEAGECKAKQDLSKSVQSHL
eukprot:CAMPEP_0172890478 /NCGR_PEP_ID=MMETSP1075-20121228/141351_1 /TAXON_ID=2916 /ORGANISM="Ceratium fusus, Strain PA161109" /LENGTH=307 /DNA_ID=CAMNT_0013744743 /DNA_START=18 /DNA_END=938 /DNA_ORIENTATION=-